MCGHVGIAGSLELKDENTMKRLLLNDFFRGTDSTGMASVRKNGDLKIAKIASHPLDLFDSARFKDALSAYASLALIGHNRAKTRGENTAVNAHPFEYGHIVGAHNGTLSPSSHRALEDKLGEKFAVDSQAIFASIEKFGAEETVPLLQGAWALVWYNLEDKSLNFLRNKERSFWYAYTDDFKKLFWASEWWMIRAACDASSSKYDLYQEEGTGYQFWATEPDVWYRYELETLSKGSKERPKPYAKELKGKEPEPVAAYSTGAGGNFPRGGTHSGGSQGTQNSGRTFPQNTTNTSGTSSTTSRGKSEKSEPTVLHLEADDDNPLAGIITRERFEEIAKYGCSHCTATVSWEDRGVTIFERDDIVMCADCSGNPGDTSRIYMRSLAPFLS